MLNLHSCFSESGIWRGKILVNGVRCAKLAKVFPHQNFALYGKCVHIATFYCPVIIYWLHHQGVCVASSTEFLLTKS